MNLFTMIGIYTVWSECTKYEKMAERKRIGIALVRIEEGMDTYRDRALIEDVKERGRRALKNYNY